MLLLPYIVAAYWGPRQESAETCAKHVWHLLEAFAKISPVFEDWDVLGTSDRKYSRVLSEQQILSEILLRRPRNDQNELVPQLGFTIDLIATPTGTHRWTEKVGLHLSCGRYTMPGYSFVPNMCVIELPEVGPAAERLLHLRTLQSINRRLYSQFSPNYIVTTTRNQQVRYRQIHPLGPEIGWLTLLPIAQIQLSSLLERFTVKPIGSKASLVIATHERFNDENVDHVERIEEIWAALHSHGALLDPGSGS